jgi:hypothetical protein
VGARINLPIWQVHPAYKPSQPSGTVPVPAYPANFELRPEGDGIYKAGGDIKAPKLKHYVAAELSTEAKTRGAFNPFRLIPLQFPLLSIQKEPRRIYASSSLPVMGSTRRPPGLSGNTAFSLPERATAQQCPCASPSR